MIPTISAFTDPNIKRFKPLTWEKNHNGKLHTNGFVHIDLAPKEMPAAQLLQETVFIISTKDNPEEKHYFRLLHIDLIRNPGLLPEKVIAASHGMNQTDFIDSMFAAYPNKFTWTTQMALYYYLRMQPG